MLSDVLVAPVDGEIGLLRAEKPELRFSQGESLRVRQAVAQPEKLEVPVRVVSSSAVARAVQDKISSREEAWGVALQEWLRDERLVACYRCSGNSQSRTLENLARGTSQASTAAVVGAASGEAVLAVAPAGAVALARADGRTTAAAVRIGETLGRHRPQRCVQGLAQARQRQAGPAAAGD